MIQKYGFPYMGSKDKIVPSLAAFLPPADNFYDLFGGGASMTHYLMLKRSSKFKQFIYNDIIPGNGELLRRAIAGEFNYDRFKPPFISRDDFFRLKDTDPYVRVIWSFGNNQKDYLFGKDIESYKKSLHNAVVFGTFDEFASQVLKLNNWSPSFESIYKRRLYVRQRVKYNIGKRGDLEQLERLERLERLQRLEQLERLQQLERLERLQQLERLQRLEQLERLQLKILSESYDQIEIRPKSVIYCDPPYKGTVGYLSDFDHEKFLDWSANSKVPVYISEYEINDERFKCIYEIRKRILLNDRNKQNKKPKLERLYWNRVSNDS